MSRKYNGDIDRQNTVYIQIIPFFYFLYPGSRNNKEEWKDVRALLMLKEKISHEDSGNKSAEVGKQSEGNGITCFFDPDRSEIKGYNIKGGIG